jgi:hypothetical protein
VAPQCPRRDWPGYSASRQKILFWNKEGDWEAGETASNLEKRDKKEDDAKKQKQKSGKLPRPSYEENCCVDVNAIGTELLLGICRVDIGELMFGWTLFTSVVLRVVGTWRLNDEAAGTARQLDRWALKCLFFENDLCSKNKHCIANLNDSKTHTPHI